jgi:hypothetical protein
LLLILRKYTSESFQEEFLIIHQQNGKYIEILQMTMMKHYTSSVVVKSLRNLYQQMKGQVPYIDHIVCAQSEKILFEPKGERHKPSSVEELVKAFACVLSALKVRFLFFYIHVDA